MQIMSKAMSSCENERGRHIEQTHMTNTYLGV